MIHLLCGENDFALTQKIAQLRAGFAGVAERYDSSDLTAERLADLFAGQTLFGGERLVIIDGPSASSDLWQNMPAWAERLNADTTLVLVEPKPDKRTATYNWLKKHADVQEFAAFGERDAVAAVKWLEEYAARQSVKLTSAQARRITARAGVNQWQLAQAVDKLALAGEVTDEWIDAAIEQTPSESVFALFETALKGDGAQLEVILKDLRQTEDPYRVFGLINSQLIQLVALVYGDGNISKVATDTGAKSSYPLQKLAPYASRMGKQQAAGLVRVFAAADSRLKSSDADPWLVLENTLVRVASR